MTVVDCKQRTDEWHAQRLGRITASRFGDVMTEPKTKADRENGVLSATAHSYMLELLAEHLTGVPNSIPTTQAMQHGIDCEDSARRVYERITGRTVQQVGFVVSDKLPGVGCSPDGLVGDVGMCEIKCPYNRHEHLRTWFTGSMPNQYEAQVQGQMWVCKREWADFVSYDPRQANVGLALAIVRVKRDDAFILKLERCCERLLDKLAEALDRANKVEAIACDVHHVAHLCSDPITFQFNGEVIEL